MFPVACPLASVYLLRPGAGCFRILLISPLIPPQKYVDNLYTNSPIESHGAQVKTVMQEQESTLQAVAAALATGSMPFDSSGLRKSRQGHRETMTWDVGKSVAVTENEGLGRNSQTRRLLPIFDSPMASHIRHVDPVQPELINVTQGPLGMQLGDPIRPLAGAQGDAPSLMDMDNAGSALVRDHPESDWATCSIKLCSVMGT